MILKKIRSRERQFASRNHRIRKNQRRQRDSAPPTITTTQDMASLTENKSQRST